MTTPFYRVGLKALERRQHLNQALNDGVILRGDAVIEENI